MNTATQLQELLAQFGTTMLVFLPVLFGAVEFIKEKLGFKGRAVELLAVGIFLLFGVLVVITFYYPEKGVGASAIVLFLLMCALAPSGYYKFIDSRAPKM
ncbi:hypothetical protein ACFLXI_05225 [Chloroflexota bacterium]